MRSKLRMFVYNIFFKQKTAYENDVCDWNSDVCSSDLSLTHRYPSPTLNILYPVLTNPTVPPPPPPVNLPRTSPTPRLTPLNHCAHPPLTSSASFSPPCSQARCGGRLGAPCLGVDRESEAGGEGGGVWVKEFGELTAASGQYVFYLCSMCHVSQYQIPVSLTRLLKVSRGHPIA